MSWALQRPTRTAVQSAWTRDPRRRARARRMQGAGGTPVRAYMIREIMGHLSRRGRLEAGFASRAEARKTPDCRCGFCGVFSGVSIRRADEVSRGGDGTGFFEQSAEKSATRESARVSAPIRDSWPDQESAKLTRPAPPVTARTPPRSGCCAPHEGAPTAAAALRRASHADREPDRAAGGWSGGSR